MMSKRKLTSLDDVPVSYLEDRKEGKKRCHCCGRLIRGNALVKIEGKTGKMLLYCSGHCLETDWK